MRFKKNIPHLKGYVKVFCFATPLTLLLDKTEKLEEKVIGFSIPYE